MDAPRNNREKPLSDRASLSVNEYCETHGVSRATVYREMAAGRLKFFMIASHRRIPTSEENSGKAA
jgi:excisionase family DNA binding protein